MTICAVAAVLACTTSAAEPSTSEEHVERTVGTILSNVAKMKRTDGTIVPMAFWNFDGTIIKGGVAEGLSEDGVECYKGLVEEGILGGWSRTYGGEEGWIRFRDVDYPRLVRLGGQCAWPFNAQIFAGTKASDLDRFCLRKFRETYRKWYFTSSVAILRRLEAAGVENYIISECPEIFIRNAAESLGLDQSRMNAIRVGIDGGRITSRIEEPLPIGDGKVEVMRRIVAARTNAYAVAGFGNSYGSDGQFMRAIVRQDLPGGAKGVAVMINGSGSPEGFEDLFTCVTQTAVGMPAGRWTSAENLKIETGELQSRIDAVSAAGGGTVTIGPGLHRAGTLVLRDGVTLRLEKGALLKAVHGKGHYAREDGPAFIWATNAVHVAIEGPGTIDGSGDELPRDRDFSPRPRLVLFEDCRDVRVEDVALRASARWTLALHRVDGFAIRRVDILTHAHYNNDGIDLMAKNGVVEDCAVDSDDDAVVMKTLSPGFTVENVTVRRCRLSSNMNLIKIGTETWGGFRNILVEDVKAEVRTPSAVWPYAVATPNGDPEKPYCKSGIAIMVVDGGTLEDVTVRNVDLKGCQTPIFIRLNRRHVQPGRETCLRRVLIEDVTAEASSSIASSITGLKNLRVRDVTVRNATFVLPGGCTKAMCAHPVPECENGIPTNQMFGFHPLPAHGFYIRHADGVRLENVRCFTRNPDERPAVVRDDAAAVDFDVFVAGGTLKAVRAAVAARGEGKRVFLAAPRPYCGEDRAATLDLERHPEDDVADPLIREIFNPQYRASGAYNVLPAKGWRAVQKFEPYETVETAPVTGALDTVTTPLLVKRACDRALLAAKVEFLTAAPVIATERTEAGNWRVTYAVRGGERTVVVREFVDCRLPRRVAKGRHDFSYRVVRGPKPHIETIDFSYDVPTSDARGLLAVENHARSLVGTSNLLDVAEWVTVKDPAETPPVPVDVTCDVVVAGGGTGGGPAAVAAARAGAKTILVEYQNILGGVSSEGRIGGFGSYYDGNVCGFTKELEDGERKLGGAYFFARGEWLRREIVRSGGEVWLGTMVTGAEMSGSRLVGVRVVLPDGTRGLIRCKTAVDATGNSDLAAAAGARTEFITGDELSLQGCGMAGQPFGAWCVNSDIGFVDETDAADLCFFALRSRLSLPDRVWNQSSLVDSRERRRIVGDFRISPVDLLLNRRYPDVICQARSTFDTHGQTSHPVFFIRDTGKRGDCIRGNVPYRALLPKGVEGLLVTGLGISAHRDAMPVLRMKADIQNQGYAAGLAAALAAKESLTPRQLNVRRLQERLVSVGNLPDEVLTWEDSLPLPRAALESAVERLSDGYDGLPEVLSDPVRALPLLRARPGFERAHVRALLGDLTAAPELIARLEGLSWDEGWDYKGMSQYLRSVGTVDRYVIALGRTRAGAALPVLDRLASELTGESAYSHFRALALAYESIGDPRGAAALQRLLALPGVGGHAWRPGEVRPIPGYSDLPTNKERSDALRELCVARALFRLGDPSGAARLSLESYADDPRRAFANHARQVLMSAPVPVPDGVYDGSQSNAVVGVTDVGGAKTATLSCRVQTNPNENRTWKVLAQSGDPLKPGGIRLAYNIRREGRIWGVFGGTRVFSPPQVLDDGKLHHVAFEVSPGRDLRLFVDGRQVATDKAPDETIADGLLTAGQRVVVDSADDGWYYETGRAQHFRGRIVDVAVRKGPFDPRAVAGGVEPREQALTIPPNPLERPAVWERPKTTRRYLQGPFSERLLVYFREGKILFGENEHKDDWSVAYKDLVSHAAWLVKGERAEPLDFRQAELSLSDGGEPDCAQIWRQDGLEITLSACAPWGRRPSAHLRLSVRNLSPNDRTESFGFLLRTAPEKDLVFGAPDIYASYAPSIADWDRIGCSDWKRDGETMRSGDRFAAVREGDFAWDEGRGMLRFGFDLKPGETRTAELELGRGESDGMDFGTARAAMCRDWTRELARIRLPKAVADDAAKSRLIRHLAVQMLQCFAHPVGGDAVLPRQGGLQRYVWPGDAISFLSAMDELGYGDRVARAIDFYFDHCIRPTGEAGPFRNRWACDTGCVLESFARHVLLTRDESCWRRHRDAAFRAFDWIESKRREGGGLFPSMKSTDHGAASRHWGMTDMYSLTGLTDFAEAAERMGDPRAREVRRAVCDYRAAINGVLDGWKERASGRDELMIPLTTDGAADDGLLEDYMFASHYGKFADFGFLSEPDMLRVRRWLLRRRYADENGLYSNQVSRNGQRKDEHVWYTTWQDQHWFNAWMRVGRHDLARTTLAATLKFALTDEYLVGERYHDADAWYYPWSPNASGSGRIVQMLLADTTPED